MRRPKRSPALDALEPRRLLAVDLPTPEVPVQVEPQPEVEAPLEVQTAAQFPPRDDAVVPLAVKKETLKRFRVTIYGVVLPAKLATGGKSKGAAVVGGGVVWLLDLSGVKGFPGYAQRLVQKPVAVYGSAELTKDAKGVIKRKIKVNWMEPLEQPALPHPFPNGVPKPKAAGPR